MTKKKVADSKTRTLDALQEWSVNHNPLDLSALITTNPKLFYDLAKFGVPKKDADLVFQTAARLAKETVKRARGKEGLLASYNSAKSRRSSQISKDIAEGNIPQGKRWLMGGLPVGKRVVRRILSDDPKSTTSDNSYAAVADLLKAKHLSIPELMEKTGLGKSQTQSILVDLEGKGVLKERHHGSTRLFFIGSQRRRSKNKKR